MSGGKRIRVMKGTALIIIAVFSAVSAWAETEPHKKGSFTAVFEEYSPLSSPRALERRMGSRANRGARRKHDYDIRTESFEVYVPDSYDSNTPFGLMVWISPSPSGGMPPLQGIQEMMDKYKLIWVGANKSGNKEYTYVRRVPLALDGAYNMEELYNIDPNRVYVAGLSGGGRIASITAFHHSDVYSGGIFIIGANYWESMRAPGTKNARWRSGGPRPKGKYLRRAKKFGRYVFLTGEHDGNRLQMHTYYEKRYRKKLDNVLYIEVPGMGHEVPPAEEFEKALKYVDTPLLEKAVRGRATKKRNDEKVNAEVRK